MEGSHWIVYCIVFVAWSHVHLMRKVIESSRTGN